MTLGGGRAFNVGDGVRDERTGAIRFGRVTQATEGDFTVAWDGPDGGEEVIDQGASGIVNVSTEGDNE